MLVLFSDFGVAGPYVGQMKAVLHQHAPGVEVVDLMHDAPAFNPRVSAYLLAALAEHFPVGSVFLAVVDPGVGSTRETAAVKIDGRWFVGPDNGLFAILARRGQQVHWHRIRWRPTQLSVSFHGRDLFAPIAARLAANTLSADMLEPAEPAVQPDWPDELAEIIYIDPYGNAFTGLRASSVSAMQSLCVGHHMVAHTRTFSAVPVGQPFWYENACGLVEIAINQGSAAAQYALAPGARLTVTPLV